MTLVTLPVGVLLSHNHFLIHATNCLQLQRVQNLYIATMQAKSNHMPAIQALQSFLLHLHSMLTSIQVNDNIACTMIHH
jgi:hypothetical protein